MIRRIQARAALTESKLPASDYCINPYVGCVHGCTYCYARFMKRFTGHGDERWGSFLDARDNIAELLEHELARKKPTGSVLIGSVTDAYQPAERSLGLTRAALSALVSAPGLAVSVLTKSALVTRDIDLFSQMPDATVGLTITSLSETAQRALEPCASPPSGRIQALQELHAAGISTYVFIGPVIPLVTDVTAIIDAVASSVDEVWGESLNLRGADKAALRDSLSQIIGEGRVDESLALCKSTEFWSDIESEMTEACQQRGLPAPRFFRH